MFNQVNMDIIVFGGGGHAAVVFDCLQRIPTFRVTAVVDDDRGKHGTSMFDRVRIEDPEILTYCSTRLMHCAIGNNTVRQSMFDRFSSLGYTFPSIVHPCSVVSMHCSIGSGTFVAAGCVCEARSKIGRCCIVNTNSSINHDCIIGDFAHIAPGAVLCGSVTIGNNSLIGANSTVLPGITIGENVVVGAGSVVTKNVINNSIVYGSPAKPSERIRTS